MSGDDESTHGDSDIVRLAQSLSLSDVQCMICLNPIEEHEKAILPVCQHQFCISCIKSWSEQRTLCPLCKTEFGEVYYDVSPDGSFKKIVFESTYKNFEIDDSAQYDCLDHAYFLEEVNKFLNRAESTLLKWKQRSGSLNFRKVASVNERRNYALLEDITTYLVYLRHELEVMASFEPLTVLGELQRIEKTLDALYSGRPVPESTYEQYSYLSSPSTASSGSKSTSRSSARSNNRHHQNSQQRTQTQASYYDDDEDYDEDEEYYDDEDDYGAGRYGGGGSSGARLTGASGHSSGRGNGFGPKGSGGKQRR